MLKKGIMAAALAVLAAGAFAQKQQVMLDKVVAVVGSSSILYSEVADHARQLTAQRRVEELYNRAVENGEAKIFENTNDKV